MSSPLRACPVTPCGAQLEAGHLMCRDHWKAVPRPLRREVNRTWRALRQAKTTDAVAGYYDARQRAIDAARSAMP